MKKIRISFLIIACLVVSPQVYADIKTASKSVSELSKSEKKEVTKEEKERLAKLEKHRVSEDEIKKIKKDAVELKKKWSIQISRDMTIASAKRIERAQKYLGDGNFTRALELVDTVISRPNTNSYEKSKALVLKTQALMSMKDYAKAEDSITKAIELSSLGYEDLCEALMFLSQIQTVTQNYKDAKKNLIKYIEVSPEKSPAAYFMLATIDNELGDTEAAEVSVTKALKDNKNPQEQWLYFASVIYLRTKKFAEAEKILKELLDKRQNNKNYWMTLIGVLVENGKTGEALQYVELANKLGYLNSSSDINNRAAVLFQEKIPYKAAVVLENAVAKKEIQESQKIYEFIASFWFVAKEYDRSIAAYKKASALSDSGAVELLLGQVYLEQEDWKNAQKSFHAAIKKGNLKTQKGNAMLGLGMTAYFQDDKVSALKYFNQAQSFKQQREAADRWISFLK